MGAFEPVKKWWIIGTKGDVMLEFVLKNEKRAAQISGIEIPSAAGVRNVRNPTGSPLAYGIDKVYERKSQLGLIVNHHTERTWQELPGAGNVWTRFGNGRYDCVFVLVASGLQIAQNAHAMEGGGGAVDCYSKKVRGQEHT